MNELQQSQSSIKYSNVLLSEHANVNKTEAKHIFCFFYFIGVLSVLLLLLINYFVTSSNFEANEYVPIQIEVACNEAINLYQDCLEKLNEKDENKDTEQTNCNEETKNVEQCYNSVFSINKMCFIYISEYHLCKSKKKSCSGITADFIECAHRYKGINPNELLSLID